MGYAVLTNDKFTLDYVVGMYAEELFATVPTGGSIDITAGTLPAGLRLDPTDWKLKGVATTEGDYDITYDILDSGSVVQDTVDVTIVVVKVTITYSDSPISYANYATVNGTFTYTIEGPYTLDDVTNITWANNGSQLLGDKLTLTLGVREEATYTGRTNEVGNFLFSLRTTNEVGHVYDYRESGEITYNLASATDKPEIQSCEILGSTKNEEFNYEYSTIQGQEPYTYKTNYNYPSLNSKILTEFGYDEDIDTGNFSITPTLLGSWDFRKIVKDVPLQKVWNNVAVSKVHCSSSWDGLLSGPGVNVYYATVSGTDGYLTKYNVDADTVDITSAFSTHVADIAGPDEETEYSPTFVYAALKPSASTTHPIKKVLISDMSISATTNVTSASSSTYITELVRSPYSDNMLVLFNGDPVQKYTMSTDTLSSTAVSASKNYSSGCVTYDGTTEYFWILNQTDGTLLKYNAATNSLVNTYTIVGATLTPASCYRERIINHNNEKILITDSAAGKIFIFNIGAGTFSSQTLTNVTPVGIFSDGSLIYVMNSQDATIVCYNTDFSVRYTTSINISTYLDDIYTGDTFPDTTTTVSSPILKGSVVVSYYTNDWGLITLTDDGNGNLISSHPSSIYDGTVDYCSGDIDSKAYTEDDPFTVYLSYKLMPNEFAGVILRDTLQTYFLTNINFEVFCDEIDYIDHVLKVGILTFSEPSFRLFEYTVGQTVSDTITIAGGTTDYDVSVLGCDLPDGLTLNYPDPTSDDFTIDGTLTTAEIKTATIQVLDSVIDEMIFVGGEDNAYEEL